MGRWLEGRGYRTRLSRDAFTDVALADADIVVILAPLAERNVVVRTTENPAEDQARVFRRPIASAFSPDEIVALHAFVDRGGGLLLVSDHFPYPGALEALAAACDIELINGFLADERRLPPVSGQTYRVVAEAPPRFTFLRGERTLESHPVTNGRTRAERVDSVVMSPGSALRLPAGGQSLLVLGPTTVALLPEGIWDCSDATPRH